MTGILKYITYITYNMKKPVITVGAFVFATLFVYSGVNVPSVAF